MDWAPRQPLGFEAWVIVALIRQFNPAQLLPKLRGLARF